MIESNIFSIIPLSKITNTADFHKFIYQLEPILKNYKYFFHECKKKKQFITIETNEPEIRLICKNEINPVNSALFF